MHTFTCGFDMPEGAKEQELDFDERPESRVLAELLRTRHHERVLGSEAMAPALPRVVWRLDEPRVGISYQVLYTAEMISRFVTVVLSGVGGDELFAGYPWRYEKALGLDNEAFERAYYEAWIRFITDDDKKKFFSPRVIRETGDFSTFDSFRNVMRRAGTVEPLNRALYFDFKTFMNGLLLVDDKLSMAYSIEARVPFLDNELVDYVRRMPPEYKLRSRDGKIVLRQAMRGLLPDETLQRKKQGFTPPDQTRYKQENLRRYIRDLILGPRARARDYFQPAYLETILDQHLNDKENHRFLIWSLMCFEWWNRLFVDRDPLPEEDIMPYEGAPS
jgi:asparagine synthase (glutamine-hydrolysing)